jgi:hypothetical protein
MIEAQEGAGLAAFNAVVGDTTSVYPIRTPQPPSCIFLVFNRKSTLTLPSPPSRERVTRTSSRWMTGCAAVVSQPRCGDGSPLINRSPNRIAPAVPVPAMWIPAFVVEGPFAALGTGGTHAG